MNIKEELAQKQEELRAKINETRQAVADKADNADALMQEVRDYESDIKKLKELVDAMPDTLPPADDKTPTPDPATDPATDPNAAPADATAKRSNEKEKENRTMPQPVGKTPKKEYRDVLNAILHSKGENRADATAFGITSTDVGVLIPEEVIYNPEMEVNTVTDLSTLVTKTKVTSASGKYPILKRANAKMNTVAELEEAPELAKPQFTNVAWEVETRRGQIPISQESIDDAAVDLTALVAGSAKEIKINTTNADISAKLASFTTAPVAVATLVDDLKKVINVSLDVAYKKTIVLTKSMYHLLDTTKDSEGNYLLQKEIGTASGKTLSSVPLEIVEDTAFGGAAGSQQAFIGDLKRAILFADRADLELQWVQYPIYGKILEPVVRYDVQVADAEAGYFVTVTPGA